MKKKILIVSNENNLTPTLQEKLTCEGYEVNITEESGDQLKALLRKLYPDLIIVSMSISCLNAIELCLRIRRWCPIPLILINNWTATVNKSEETRSCHFLEKESVEDVMHRIQNAFSRN